MDYLQWNQKLWQHFFPVELIERQNEIVIAVTNDVIFQIGEANNIDEPIKDFFKAINSGPKELDSNQIDKFLLSERDIDFLSKAKRYFNEPNYLTNYCGRPTPVSRWLLENKTECLITAYLAYLVLMISSDENDDDSHYWIKVNENLSVNTSGTSQGYVPELFLLFKKWAKLKGFNFYYKNIYTRKKNVGTIYSQLPLTIFEEQQIMASLYLIKKEDELYFYQLSENCKNELLEDFIENQKTFLNKPTLKELNDNSSILGKVVLNYLNKNFSKYLKKIQNIPKEEGNKLEEILEKRKNEVVKLEPKYYLAIRNGNVSGAILIDLRIDNLLKSGTLCFKMGSNEYSYNTQFGKNINGEDGHSYLIYFLDVSFIPGKYKIYNADFHTGYDVEVKEENDIYKIKYPVWYKSFSKQDSEKLKIIDTDKKIYFDINNPHKIITTKLLSEETVNEYHLKLLGEKYSLKIGDNNDSKKIYILNPAETERIINFGEKKVEILNSEIKIILNGAPDGRQGITSFLKDVPVKISFNSLSISKLSLGNDRNELPIIYTDFDSNVNNEKTNIEIKEKLNSGKYSLKIYDLANNLIEEKPFIISAAGFNENRMDPENRIRICDFTTLMNTNLNTQGDKDCVYTFSFTLFEKLIDVLIQGKKIVDIYNQDFKYILNCLVEDYEPKFLTISECKNIDLLEISKKIIYILDNLNIIERENHYIKKIIKPNWKESNVERRYNLIGALKEEEIGNLNKITAIKSHSQVVYRMVKGIKIGFELPRIFHVEKCDENVLPKLHDWKLVKPSKVYNFTLEEKQFKHFEISKNLRLEVPKANICYLISASNCAVLNWFTLKFENFTVEKLKEILTYSGIKLIRVIENKPYNNREIYHFFIFKINTSKIEYAYYPNHEKEKALRYYLKHIRYFDFTSLILRANDSKKDNFYKYILNHPKTIALHKGIFEENNIGEINNIINNLDVFHLSSLELSFNLIIKNYFIFDDQYKCFGINDLILLPKEVEKYLVNLSGLLPVYKSFSIKSPNYNLDEISNGIYLQEKITTFRVFFNIPEEIAFKISNSLIDTIVYNVPGATGKPYNNVNIL
jgi:hypothetical protein